jgi:hypothetical protein
MKNWKMWLAAIGLDVLFCLFFLAMNPKTNHVIDLRGLFLIFYLNIFNLTVGLLIVIFSSTKEKKRNAIPFLFLTILIYLVGWGVCHL